MKKLLIVLSIIISASSTVYGSESYDSEIRDLVLTNQINNQSITDSILNDRVLEVKQQLNEIADGRNGFALYSPDGKYLIVSNTDHVRDITYIYETKTWENISTLVNTSGKISCINTKQKGLTILIGDSLVYEAEYFAEPHKFIYSGESIDNEFVIPDSLTSGSVIDFTDLNSIMIRSGNNIFNYKNLDNPNLIYSDTVYKKVN